MSGIVAYAAHLAGLDDQGLQAECRRQVLQARTLRGRDRQGALNRALECRRPCRETGRAAVFDGAPRGVLDEEAARARGNREAARNPAAGDNGKTVNP